MNNKNDLAWAAGFLDGDGCLAINKHYRSNLTHNVYYGISVICEQKNKYSNLDALKKLYELFGGAITKRKWRKGVGDKYITNVIRWHIMCQKAYLCVKKIHPYLIVKKKQAELMMKFQQSVNRRKKKNQKLPTRQKRFRKGLYEQMKVLNKRGNSTLEIGEKEFHDLLPKT